MSVYPPLRVNILMKNSISSTVVVFKRQTKNVRNHSSHKREGKKYPDDQLLICGEILKCAFNGHFTIPWGHGRGFVNGSEVT